MEWNLEGLYVETLYLGDFFASGLVVNSRVAYGGSVKHTIALDTPIMVYGELRDRIIVSHSEINRVKSNKDCVEA